MRKIGSWIAGLLLLSSFGIAQEEVREVAHSLMPLGHVDRYEGDVALATDGARRLTIALDADGDALAERVFTFEAKRPLASPPAYRGPGRIVFWHTGLLMEGEDVSVRLQVQSEKKLLGSGSAARSERVSYLGLALAVHEPAQPLPMDGDGLRTSYVPVYQSPDGGPGGGGSCAKSCSVGCKYGSCSVSCTGSSNLCAKCDCADEFPNCLCVGTVP